MGSKISTRSEPKPLFVSHVETISDPITSQTNIDKNFQLPLTSDTMSILFEYIDESNFGNLFELEHSQTLIYLEKLFVQNILRHPIIHFRQDRELPKTLQEYRAVFSCRCHYFNKPICTRLGRTLSMPCYGKSSCKHCQMLIVFPTMRKFELDYDRCLSCGSQSKICNCCGNEATSFACFNAQTFPLCQECKIDSIQRQVNLNGQYIELKDHEFGSDVSTNILSSGVMVKTKQNLDDFLKPNTLILYQRRHNTFL